MTEKAFSKETEEIVVLENLMQLGIEGVRAIVEKEAGNVALTGSLSYPNGTITYSVSPLSPTTSQVVLSCMTNEHRKYNARFVYDYETKEIQSWIELR
ncbi:competence type IV pilus minor pilin ComGG [Bacillus timonensis]|uniref:competence type IV pilus minor pilin ComGG n=1 Tax=Bacillus timonensis TaxID=1033734 RepID=UPI0002894D09|nr:competence type IV pilus minor pilin ComGG [Bacillus timonensis]